MKTYIIVKASTKRYHIYNCYGECVDIFLSRDDVISYLNEVFFTSSCTSYTFQYTAAVGTYILTMK